MLELILTNQNYASYEEAKTHAIEKVEDGDTLWLHFQLEKALKDYVYTQRATMGDGSVKKLYHFHLGIGPVGYDSDYQTDTIWVGEYGGDGECISPDTLEKTFFSICLSSFQKNNSSKLFISLLGDGEAGIWENEIRFYKGIIEAGADNPPLATIKILCDVDNGISKYRSMWNTYQEILEKGTADENVLPEGINFQDEETQSLVLNELRNHGLQTQKVYFTQAWTNYTDQDGAKFRKASMVYTYQKEGRCMFGLVYPRQDFSILTNNYSPIWLEYGGNGFPIACEE